MIITEIKTMWKPIPGYEGMYEISNLGMVRSLPRDVIGVDGKTYHQKGIIKSLSLDSTTGYLKVVVSKNNKKETLAVHRLVATLFLDNSDSSLEVLHGPNGKTDNSIYNLSWGTRSQNSLDKQRDGSDFQRNKTHCPRNHPLEFPNIIPSMYKITNSNRACLACNRANVWVKRNGGSQKEISDLVFETNLTPGKLKKLGMI